MVIKRILGVIIFLLYAYGLHYSIQQINVNHNIYHPEAKLTLFCPPPGNGVLWICLLYLSGTLDDI